MPLYMWEMWDVTPVTHGRTNERTVESSAVFSLSWILNCKIDTIDFLIQRNGQQNFTKNIGLPPLPYLGIIPEKKIFFSRKNCESCPAQVTWKVKFKCQFVLSCPVLNTMTTMFTMTTMTNTTTMTTMTVATMMTMRKLEVEEVGGCTHGNWRLSDLMMVKEWVIEWVSEWLTYVGIELLWQLKRINVKNNLQTFSRRCRLVILL